MKGNSDITCDVETAESCWMGKKNKKKRTPLYATQKMKGEKVVQEWYMECFVEECYSTLGGNVLLLLLRLFWRVQQHVVRIEARNE